MADDELLPMRVFRGSKPDNFYVLVEQGIRTYAYRASFNQGNRSEYERVALIPAVRRYQTYRGLYPLSTGRSPSGLTSTEVLSGWHMGLSPKELKALRLTLTQFALEADRTRSQELKGDEAYSPRAFTYETLPVPTDRPTIQAQWEDSSGDKRYHFQWGIMAWRLRAGADVLVSTPLGLAMLEGADDEGGILTCLHGLMETVYCGDPLQMQLLAHTFYEWLHEVGVYQREENT